MQVFSWIFARLTCLLVGHRPIRFTWDSRIRVQGNRKGKKYHPTRSGIVYGHKHYMVQCGRCWKVLKKR